MLKINKNAYVKFVHYNALFLFKLKELNKSFLLKKKTPYSITLRSPKHFNIGKNKIMTINTKALNLKFQFKKKIHINSLFNSADLWLYLYKGIQKNIYLLPKTITVNLKTKFKIKWLGF